MLYEHYADGAYVEKWRAFVQSLLSGYHAENKLKKDEVGAIYIISLAIQLIFIAYFSTLGKKSDSDFAKWVYANEDIFKFTI
jgi:Ser/Thr protein kinase RdoA (MazF antagonist)